ncbi:SET domain-containing protein [Anaeromyces robustus]|uniref:SET domain-containing protein n=1 Tax=Anaeromyces robustus TaxID=1754192 RepID=A0A1Y1XKR7_9FUNG|nr:SET domain-containing protein [Anaeromyces robustus]|eukprot:ORX86351.1 SET domain-containing protein [Anaeromyces robustus]
MNELVDFKKWNIPLKIEYAENKGRYVIAKQNFQKDSRIVVIKGYSTGIIDSYKKKICSVCLSINNEGFYQISCKSCNVAYYCSKVCQMYAERKLNHNMVCPLLRRLSTFKSDIHSKSIMKLLLNSLALRKSEEDFILEKSKNENNNEWLSLVPLPSDIEEYEKEISKLNVENEVQNDDIEFGDDKSLEADEINNINDNIQDISLDSDNDKEINIKKEKDEIDKKHKKKEKDKKVKDKDDKKDKKERNKVKEKIKEKDEKKSKSRKDKKSKKIRKEEDNEQEEKEKELKGEEIDEKSKKEKPKHKHSKHNNENIKTEENNEEEEENESNTDKYDIITNTIPYAGVYQDMMNLQSHYEEWTDDMKKEWQKNINFFKKLIQDSKEVNDYIIIAVKEYVNKKRNIQESDNISDIDVNAEIENYVLSFASLVESNSFGIWNNKGKCIGRIIYPFASYFNHSCRNNCYPVQYKNHIYFYASKDIQEGEEINFSYIDTEGVSLKDRQVHLLNDYYFKCQCELCLEEENELISPINTKKNQKKKDKKKKN